MAGMQDVLQAHKDINVVRSNADQHVVGAEIALQDAGVKPQSLYLSGGGASQIGIEAIRAGRWKATLAFFPVSMGRYATDAIDGALDGKKVDAVIDSDKIGPAERRCRRRWEQARVAVPDGSWRRRGRGPSAASSHRRRRRKFPAGPASAA
jgi:hypothetical protein